MEPGQWFWCLKHRRAESYDNVCPADERMGPYASKEDAENWRERAEARNREWDAEDEDEE